MFKRLFHSILLASLLAGLLAFMPVTPVYAANLTVNSLVDEMDFSFNTRRIEAIQKSARIPAGA